MVALRGGAIHCERGYPVGARGDCVTDRLVVGFMVTPGGGAVSYERGTPVGARGD